MKRNTRKIVFIALAVFVCLPIALILAGWAWFAVMDQTNGTITSSGLHRRYLLYVPKTYSSLNPAPLVISLHPAATWPALMMRVSRWNEVADQHGLIVVYPAGTGAFFDGLGPGPQVFPMGPHSFGRDVQFISDLIDKLEVGYNIDRNRVYVNGMSNGGGMALALSCKLSDRIAAAGVVAGAYESMDWNWCHDSRPLALIAFHGTADPLAPYLGGSSRVSPRPFPNIANWTARMSQRNHCQRGPTESQVSPNVRRLAYSNCIDDADVILYTVFGGGHCWPGGKPLLESWAGPTTQEIDASSTMWDFFAHHPLPTPSAAK